MSNVYDVLAQRPALSKAGMFVELERLAERLVQSGRFRVDAGERLNYIRFSHPAEGIFKIFSKRELTDPSLMPITREHMRRLLAKKAEGDRLERLVDQEMARLQHEIARFIEVPHETEMKLARAMVQAAHPSVIMLMLWEEVEVFAAYSHTVGDMLDIEGWQRMGSSSGLQSTAGRRDYCIYSSAGGDPFLTGEYATAHDGPAALARLMVIAAQEMGHFADIKRDRMGRPVARHSADIAVSRPDEAVRLARLNDLREARHLQEQLQKLGLSEGVKLEQSAAFYATHRAKDRIARQSKRKAQAHAKKFLAQCERLGWGWVRQLPAHERPLTQLQRMTEDMIFNLAPLAEAYRHENPVTEEAIACAEALARVPQQALKWSHRVTGVFMPGLYKIYYGQVIPAVVQAYEDVSGQRYSFTYTRPERNHSSWRKPLIRLGLLKP